MSPRALPRLAWVSGVVALALSSLGVTAMIASTAPASADDLVTDFVLVVLLLAFTLPVVGTLIAARHPRNPIGWILLAIALLYSLQIAAFAYAAPAGDFLAARPLAAEVAWLANWIWVLAFGLLPFVLLLFPDGRLPSSKWRPVPFILAAALAVDVVARAVALWPLRGGAVTMEVESLGGPLPLVARAAGLVTFIGVAVGVVVLVLRLRRSAGTERAQLKWVTYSGALLAVAATSSLVSSTVSAYLLVVAAPAFPGAFAIAILRYRLYDIDVVINKTLVYGALAAFITTVYVGVVVGLGNLLGTRGQLNLPLQVAATALVALAFQPVRATVQRLANRLVYGERATPYEAMADFAARMSGVIEVEEVLPRIAEAAARSVGGLRGRAAVVLSDGSRREARWPPDAPDLSDDVILPAEHAGEQVGEIAVAKGPGDPVRTGEEGLLRDLASQAGVALHNVRLAADLRERLDEISRQAEELRRSRARLLTAADGERRRVERSIERGPQRKLDAITGALREALSGLDAGTGAVAPLLAGLREEAQATLEDVRDLARGIYPPLLADAGLSAAIEAEARKLSVVTVATERVGRYPEDVESGLYFCVVEAVRGASVPVAVRLFEADGMLAFEVAADGALQLDDEAVQGIRDRIEALGGEVVITAREIRARIPARVTEEVG